MAYRGKKRRNDDCDCIDDDSDSGSGAPRNKKKEPDRVEDGITVCELSKNRKVTVRAFKSTILIDIREYYGKDGDSMPSKKGISLTLDQWNMLRDHAEDIDGAIAELNQ